MVLIKKNPDVMLKCNVPGYKQENMTDYSVWVYRLQLMKPGG